MDESKATPKAVVLSAILHIGIVGFLFLAVLPCSSYEAFFEALHLPAWMNRMSCDKPLQLQGQVIEATLIGTTGSPPPKAVKVKPTPNTTPPPPTVPPPPTPPVEAPVKTLPPPPKQPDVKDQERVVEDAAEQAEAKQLQEEKQRQRQAEIDAQAAKQKQEKQKQLDDIFAKMDAASAQTRKLDNKAKQARQQMEDLKNAQDDGEPDLPAAAQRQTGNNSQDSSLADEYRAAIQNTLKQNWLGAANIPEGQQCLLHIIQLPGGDVLSATVDSSCPYDEAGRKSVEDAARRAGTLPYKGFETVFSRKIDMYFKP